MMPRVPEPELMDTEAQAAAYAAADFGAPNAAFVDHVARVTAQVTPGRQALTGQALDLGCGPADIPIRLARAYPRLRIDALDGAEHMLAHARQALVAEPPDVAARVRLRSARLPDPGLPSRAYDFIFSNSLLHHLHAPQVLWQTVRDAARSGATVVVMDLLRPFSQAAARDIVQRYAACEPDVLRTDFYQSLCAAFTPDEIRDQLAEAGLSSLTVAIVSDRHLLVSGRLP